MLTSWLTGRGRDPCCHPEKSRMRLHHTTFTHGTHACRHPCTCCSFRHTWGGVKGSSSVTSHTHGHPHPSSALRPTCILWFQPAPHYHAALSLSPISPPIGFLPSSILTLPAEDGHRVKGAGEEEGHVPFGAAGSDTAGGWQELGWRAAIVRPEVQGGERWDNPAGWGRRLKVGDSDGGSKDRVEPQCRAGRSSFPLQRSSSLLYTVHKCVLSCRGGGRGKPVAVAVTSVENPKKGRRACVIGKLRSGGFVVVCRLEPSERCLAETGPSRL